MSRDHVQRRARRGGCAVLLWLAALAGCAPLPQQVPEPSACADGEATHACQVERYHNISTP